ncbi:MAG TPA: hypothetical protein VN026_10580 [Bacteroidia bacterium]|jgi:hypothetical protein|nr:hypothetical protein [Bacteroidia bacterium]
MKRITSVLIIILMFIGLFQSNAQSNFLRKWTRFGMNLESTTLSTPWIFGLGWSAVDDDGGRWFTKNLFRVDKTWNMVPYPARTSCEKIIDTLRGWSAEVIFSYNCYGVGKYISDAAPQPRGLVQNRSGIVTFDFHAKYDFNKIYNLNKLWGGQEIFQPFCVFGHGYTYRDMAPHHNTITMNMGLGFNVYIYDGFGIQIQSLAKFGLKNRFPTSGSNYIQHSIGIVYKMNPLALHKSKSYKYKKHSIRKVL